ncbi:c-type cytochrome [Pontibacter pamirensis]|uniref:c-type cytochrome n=1 Tax=Pontibacter pamirensis TaxID=2562824 RepID=UPI0013895E84|nr:c-type cytochrome [Pontibacter pamirensis]
MKKIWMVISCCTFMAACGSSETTEGEEYYNRDNTEETPVYSDANSDAELSAATRQSEVDTSINQIGTDRSPEVATAPATTTDAATANTSTDAAKTTAAKPVAQENFDKGKNLIATSDCLACHQVEARLVGPGYVEVAEKYEFNDKNVDYLAGKIIEGGAGVWGQIPMSPHPDLSREDAREMAKYVLSLKK